MAFNDSLSDMLARIKNAHQANKVSTLCLKSKLNVNVLSVLKDEGYIRDFKDIEERKGVSSIKIDLKYYNGDPVIKKIKRISKPGIRKYSKISELSKIELKTKNEIKKTVIIVSHRINTLKFCDKVYSIDKSTLKLINKLS
mgnify:CR=1 FL=1